MAKKWQRIEINNMDEAVRYLMNKLGMGFSEAKRYYEEEILKKGDD